MQRVPRNGFKVLSSTDAPCIQPLHRPPISEVRRLPNHNLPTWTPQCVPHLPLNIWHRVNNMEKHLTFRCFYSKLCCPHLCPPSKTLHTCPDVMRDLRRISSVSAGSGRVGVLGILNLQLLLLMFYKNKYCVTSKYSTLLIYPVICQLTQ